MLGLKLLKNKDLKAFSMCLLILMLLSLSLGACRKDEPDANLACAENNFSYYSDYFVFVADESEGPLVIPMDINWTPTPDGYLREFKGWYGTEAEWPIGYFLLDSNVTACQVPQESWEHANGPYFQFDEANREVISTIWNAPELRLKIPDSTEWIATPAEMNKGIYACRTTATVDGILKNGWLIYERIRRNPAQSQVGGGDFETFFWLPLIINGEFYHFAQHKGEQTASKWTESGGEVVVESIPDFELNILATSTDSISGRTNIPDTIQVVAEEWNVLLTMVSTGAQVGHGPMFPNGLAYYRQSLLQPVDTSSTQGYGMLELIIEDD